MMKLKPAVWMTAGAVIGLLGACSGSSKAVNTPPPPTPQADAFVVAVQSRTTTAPEDVEPADVGVTAETTPEDKEPEPIT
jgi:hypothetical protein